MNVRTSKKCLCFEARNSMNVVHTSKKCLSHKFHGNSVQFHTGFRQSFHGCYASFCTKLVEGSHNKEPSVHLDFEINKRMSVNLVLGMCTKMLFD